MTRDHTPPGGWNPRQISLEWNVETHERFGAFITITYILRGTERDTFLAAALTELASNLADHFPPERLETIVAAYRRGIGWVLSLNDCELGAEVEANPGCIRVMHDHTYFRVDVQLTAALVRKAGWLMATTRKSSAQGTPQIRRELLVLLRRMIPPAARHGGQDPAFHGAVEAAFNRGVDEALATD